MKQDPAHDCCSSSGPAAKHVCPLSKMQPGAVVCVRQLNASADMRTRLRELGIIEESKITLLTRNANLICMVCNGRLGISHKLADSILVQELETGD